MERAVSHLQALLRVAQLARGTDLPSALPQIATVVGETLGYGAVVVNLYRPAWDDLEVVAVHGSEAARGTLLGTTCSREGWLRLLDERHLTRGAYFLPYGDADWGGDGVTSFVPDLPVVEDAGAWHPEDGLLVAMRDGAGELLAVLSVDEPRSGRRPGDVELDFLVATAGCVGAAIEQALTTAIADRHRVAVQELLRVSSELSAGSGKQQVLARVTTGIAGALGFERVVIYLAEEDGMMRPHADVGWDADGGVPVAEFANTSLDAFLAPEHLREGCSLLDPEIAEPLRRRPEEPRAYVSQRCGSGPHAWRDHWLLVPLRDDAHQLLGVIWVEDPADRLLPSREQLQALRLFADQATSALEAARQLERVQLLAERDPLTGLHNRRALEATLGGAFPQGLALLVFDLDHFKRVNDQLGHDAGDEALVRFARVLAAAARDTDVAVRLGGEEFALVLPGADIAAGFTVGERVRRGTHAAFDGFPREVTVSVGVTAGASGGGLLREADRALYVAKRSGRDRCVIHRPESIDALIEEFGELGGGSADHLGAILVLAETLDLRDDATARHSRRVGRYAELIGRQLGLEPDRVERLRIAGVLHDVGKVGVSHAVLGKPGPLEPHEWAEIHRHPEIGARILANAGLDDLAAWVLAHHERVDGAGYPAGLVGDEIPLEARVLSVAGAYEAMTADRPYRPALAVAEAQAELERGAGTQFDAGVVSGFLAVLRVDAVRAMA